MPIIVISHEPIKASEFAKIINTKNFFLSIDTKYSCIVEGYSLLLKLSRFEILRIISPIEGGISYKNNNYLRMKFIFLLAYGLIKDKK